MKCASQNVLSTMLQLYRESNLLPDVLHQKNSDHCNPLRLAIVNDQFEKMVLLFKECLAIAEDAITALDPRSIVICTYSQSNVF